MPRTPSAGGGARGARGHAQSMGLPPTHGYASGYPPAAASAGSRGGQPDVAALAGSGQYHHHHHHHQGAAHAHAHAHPQSYSRSLSSGGGSVPAADGFVEDPHARARSTSASAGGDDVAGGGGSGVGPSPLATTAAAGGVSTPRGAGQTSVTVAVRCRPLPPHEEKDPAQLALRMADQTVVVRQSPKHPQQHTFTFDRAFWSVPSHVSQNPYATQDKVYNEIGRHVLEDAFKGYNCCILAYGQTGSGKSYSMFGTDEPELTGSGSSGGGDARGRRRSASASQHGRSGSASSRTSAPGGAGGKLSLSSALRPRSATAGGVSATSFGLIPRIVTELYDYITSRPDFAFRVEISFYQIYLERVTCLLNTQQGVLKVREHPLTGPYVEDLTSCLCHDRRSMMKVIAEGSKARKVAFTRQNACSSRSHAVIAVTITQQSKSDKGTPATVSRMSLVDLAGSERVSRSGSVGQGVIEATTINRSLSILGKVISILSSKTYKRAGGKNVHVPYRDSVLTWLLRESLGGNSRTVMLATVSSSMADREESLATLRYAEQAKRIVNKAVVNESSNIQIVEELQREIKFLQEQLYIGADQMLQDKLFQSQKLMEQMSKTWDDKWASTQRLLREREMQATKWQEEKQTMSRQIKQLEAELQRAKEEQANMAQLKKDFKKLERELHDRGDEGGPGGGVVERLDRYGSGSGSGFGGGGGHPGTTSSSVSSATTGGTRPSSRSGSTSTSTSPHRRSRTAGGTSAANTSVMSQHTAPHPHHHAHAHAAANTSYTSTATAGTGSAGGGSTATTPALRHLRRGRDPLAQVAPNRTARAATPNGGSGMPPPPRSASGHAHHADPAQALSQSLLDREGERGGGRRDRGSRYGSGSGTAHHRSGSEGGGNAAPWRGGDASGSMYSTPQKQQQQQGRGGAAAVQLSPTSRPTTGGRDGSPLARAPPVAPSPTASQQGSYTSGGGGVQGERAHASLAAPGPSQHPPVKSPPHIVRGSPGKGAGGARSGYPAAGTRRGSGGDTSALSQTAAAAARRIDYTDTDETDVGGGARGSHHMGRSGGRGVGVIHSAAFPGCGSDDGSETESYLPRSDDDGDGESSSQSPWGGAQGGRAGVPQNRNAAAATRRPPIAAGSGSASAPPPGTAPPPAASSGRSAASGLARSAHANLSLTGAAVRSVLTPRGGGGDTDLTSTITSDSEGMSDIGARYGSGARVHGRMPTPRLIPKPGGGAPSTTTNARAPTNASTRSGSGSGGGVGGTGVHIPPLNTRLVRQHKAASAGGAVGAGGVETVLGRSGVRMTLSPRPVITGVHSFFDQPRPGSTTTGGGPTYPSHVTSDGENSAHAATSAHNTPQDRDLRGGSGGNGGAAAGARGSASDDDRWKHWLDMKRANAGGGQSTPASTPSTTAAAINNSSGSSSYGLSASGGSMNGQGHAQAHAGEATGTAAPAAARGRAGAGAAAPAVREPRGGARTAHTLASMRRPSPAAVKLRGGAQQQQQQQPPPQHHADPEPPAHTGAPAVSSSRHDNDRREHVASSASDSASDDAPPSDEDSGERSDDYDDVAEDSDDESVSSDRRSIVRRTQENTRDAISNSERARKRIDDDYQRQKLGLAPLHKTELPTGRGAQRTVSFAETPPQCITSD